VLFRILIATPVAFLLLPVGMEREVSSFEAKCPISSSLNKYLNPIAAGDV
jgi:hypothetical protein